MILFTCILGDNKRFISRQVNYTQLKCWVSTGQPCGHWNVAENGRPARCFKLANAIASPQLKKMMSLDDCWQLCSNWNNNPPEFLRKEGRLPCVGFESSATSTGKGGGDGTGRGVCGLIITTKVDCNFLQYTLRPIRVDGQEPANRAYSAADICRLTPRHNYNQPKKSCYRIFPSYSPNDTCPPVTECSLREI